MLALKQGCGAMGISDYISSFRTLLVGAKSMGENDKLFFFMQGLREDVGKFVRMTTPTTLAGAEATAIRVGVASMPISAHAAASSSSAPMDVNNIYDDGETGASAREQMSSELFELLNAMAFRGRAPTTGLNARGAQGARMPPQSFETRKEWPKYTGRSEADMKRLMKGRLCFECQQEGHPARDCPTKLKSKN